MIDYFALALTHALLLVMLWRLMIRPDLDREEASTDQVAPPPSPPSERARRRARRARGAPERGDA